MRPRTGSPSASSLRHARRRAGQRRSASRRSTSVRGYAASGFTLIELIVVFAILAMLVSLAVPRYFAHLDRTKEATLKHDLNVMRDAIDKYYGDKGKYPDTLQDLEKDRYIRSIPVDPITESATSWVVVHPPAELNAKGEVYDVKSGAEGKGADDKPYAEW